MNVLQRPSADFYSHLFECNEPPTDEERANIIDKLRELETRREELTNNSSPGKASSLRATAHIHVPKKVAIVHQEISRHRNLLSSLRSIPIEVWQQIFVFVLLGVDTSQNHYDGVLQRLCYTSRLWNIAAKSERGLWCRFPTFRFKGKVLGGSTATRRVEFYLSMSGTLPFSFSFSYQHHPSLSWSKISQPAMVLKALVAASSRWKSATLTIPHDILFLLNPIHNHIPFLENLDLTFLQGSRLYRSRSLDIDHFSLAPNLRHVRFNLSAEGEWAARTWVRTSFRLKLPWHQLESMQNNVHHDTSYSEIVRLSERLVGLDFGAMWANFQALSAKPISLPLLSTLHLKLRLDIVESGFLLHLGKLNLPSLKELKIKERTRNPDELYDAIARLVQRSGCSLERLAVGEAGPTFFPYTRAGDIARLLPTCHDLTELDFGPNLGDDNVKALSLDRLERLVPALKKLTIRCITPNSEPWEAKRIPLDPRTFFDMVRSRVSQMESPEWQSGGGDVLTIDFIGNGLDDGEFWRGQLHLFEESRLPPFDQFNISPKLVDGWAKALRRFGTDCTPPDEDDLAQHWQVHVVMEELECLDFSNQDSRIISRWGVVTFLSMITKTKASGFAVDDKRYRFRGRAKELIRKWRPFLLRDHRSCRYRWYYRSELCSTLKYVSSTVLESDDELWNSIAGIQVGC